VIHRYSGVVSPDQFSLAFAFVGIRGVSGLNLEIIANV
jgi:hypothetical protein